MNFFSTPHKINHDHKYQSRKDFLGSSKKPSSSGLFPAAPPPPYVPAPVKSAGGPHPQEPRDPSNVESQQTPQDNRRCNGNVIIINICTGWGALGLIVILALIIVPIVVTRIPRHNSALGASNSTASTTTIVVSHATTLTLTQGPTTVTVSQTPSASTTPRSSTSSSASTVVPQPIVPGPPVGIVAYGWQNGDTQLFYQNASSSSLGIIYTLQIISGVWSTAMAIAFDAMPGTTLSLSVIDYDLDSTDTDTNTDPSTYVDDITIWRIVYVDTSNTLQALEKTIQYDPDSQAESIEKTAMAANGGWVTGNLGSYGFKVSTTLYQEACTWNTQDSYFSDSNMDTYLYFDAAGGGIKKLGYLQSKNAWTELLDMPVPFTSSTLAMECTDAGDGYESMWAIDSNNYLRQYYYAESVYSMGLQWTLGATYSGPIAANSSLTRLNQEGSTALFFQAPNGTIMQLPFETSSMPSVLGAPIAIATTQLGTRIAAAGEWLQDGAATKNNVNIFYQNGTQILRVAATYDLKSGLFSGYTTPSSNSAVSGRGVSSVLLLSLCFCTSLLILF